MSTLNAAQDLMEGNPLDRLAFTGLLVAGLIVLFNRNRRLRVLLRSHGPILVFFVYCAVSILWSDYPEVAFKRWTKAVGDLVMVLIVASELEPLVALKRLLARTTYVLIPLSILFIKYYPSLGREYGKWLGETRYTGVTTNKNTLGMICLLFGLGALWRILGAYQDREDAGRTRRLIASSVILAMVFWIFWIANSMTSLACFLIASALLLAANFPAVIRRPTVMNFLVATVVSSSVAVLFLGLDPGFLQTMGRNRTLTDRTGIWALVLSMVKNPLFGTGFESFWLGPRLWKIWNVYSWGPTEAHNGYIEIFLNLGWIGVVLLALVIVTGYRDVFSAWRNNVWAGSLGLSYFVVGLIFNFTEAAFFRMMAPVWVLTLLAMISSTAISDLKVQPTAQPGYSPDRQHAQSIARKEVA